MAQNSLRTLSPTQTALYALGALLMVVGMGCYVFLIPSPTLRFYAAIAFLVGAVFFATMQCMQTYQGNDFTLRRLKNMLNLADILFVLTGILMIDSIKQFLRHMFSNITTYYTYIYNKWFLILLIAVILELYAVNRISYRLKHINNSEQD